MRKYYILLSVIFLLLPGCLEFQYSDALWAPKESPKMEGERPEMHDITHGCNNGYYTGFSASNLDPRMSSLCEPLDNGNKICAVKAVDGYSYWTTEQVYDRYRKKWVTETVHKRQYETFMLNIYINAKGLVYDCKGELGNFSFFTTKKPAPNSLASQLPQ